LEDSFKEVHGEKEKKEKEIYELEAKLREVIKKENEISKELEKFQESHKYVAENLSGEKQASRMLDNEMDWFTRNVQKEAEKRKKKG
ncbi:hypothetical protein, partial [Pseudomonas sp. 2995-3]|uniref:hypothetical protein n=1 Tax=Pseudomonas sp. 2995-3 TaxID=1712680 RepID=UPI000C3701C1